MANKVQRKAQYHHGELREALIGATRQLVEERGAENFTLADACRVAGVSTAAPYRHFKGKQEILDEIASRGFDELRAKSMEAVAAAGEGTLEAIVAMGQAYVATNLRLGESTDVRAIAEMSDGTLLMTKREVRVIVGGCGGSAECASSKRSSGTSTRGGGAGRSAEGRASSPRRRSS